MSKPSELDASAARKVDRLGMAAIEYREIARWAQLEPDDWAKIFHQGSRTVRQQMDGESRIPGSTAIVLRLLRDGKVSLTDIKSALRR